ncbi:MULTISPECIES: hypothetical protein [Thermomonosporaceae]|uniref:hypothetical protein n=1 Tax=Thermomonosporaceae TaxID=2012 RepID=UPI00255AA723|nr:MULTISPECIES: hypothetical protein [Thermomonosporaceae]MDL4772885.1 hypothetical protein [Actinomadura xylanilytica]
MTDRLECPDCSGTGEQKFGPLTVSCLFCRGLGYVGDDNEPATRDEVESEDVHPMTATPAWDQPGGDRVSGCPQCLGTGRVISLGGDVRGGVPTQMIQTACPSCGGEAN